MDIKQSIQQIKTAISIHATKSVTLVAVSKTKATAMITEAVDAGITHIAENYVQEALPKILALKHRPIVWHYIGRIQSNKCQLLAQNFDWIQTVAMVKHAQKINQYRQTKPAVNILIQVNIDAEAQKSGVATEQVLDLAAAINALDNLKLRGIMTIPKNATEQSNDAFQRIHTLFQQLAGQYKTVDTLSMGMSADYVQAIKCGSSMVRIGSSIFGSR